jgi:hypothetical protein
VVNSYYSGKIFEGASSSGKIKKCSSPDKPTHLEGLALTPVVYATLEHI